ncbi:hypothetical protein [Psychroserpens jangbogonensis]|uniref:hypothetical protein n=1 Tax=Psychroserpens jangbogonensis TaxID=1484460 RepID=UPI00053EB0FB|nr:hypothetical protein [Psychroserpens jangbogonensis]
MKSIKFIYILLPILFLSVLTTSCSSDDDDDDPIITNEVEGLSKILDLTNATHTVELFNKEGDFYTGYNAISIRLKDNATDAYIEDASFSWMPMMQMPTMQHSSPRSAIIKASGKNTVFEGYIIYQMTNTDGSGWSLTVNYTIDGVDYTASDAITVRQNDNQNVTSFMGSDDSRYIISLIKPNNPIIGINDLMVGVHKMENMMTFPVVENYSIALDPRMPGMGNHSSPNNTDLNYSMVDDMYHADLSLTMTGYWVLNLKFMNTNDDVLKGENVTDENTQSSLYLELEF